jgi:hypothetical protein
VVTLSTLVARFRLAVHAIHEQGQCTGPLMLLLLLSCHVPWQVPRHPAWAGQLPACCCRCCCSLHSCHLPSHGWRLPLLLLLLLYMSPRHLHLQVHRLPHHSRPQN